MHKINGYNNTYCHRGASFEAALLDAMMLLGEGEAKHVLVGGIDEYSRHHHCLMSEESNMKDIVLGEGAVFFILEEERRENTFAELKDVHSFLEFNDRNILSIKAEITGFLRKHGLDTTDIDIFVSGRNGNCITDSIYDELGREFFPNAETIDYKRFCGEYMTSTAFAIALAARRLKGQKEKRALIYNHYNDINHSVILVEGV
jgi:3-oxoacyl-[acyl-carrier-protein] synthase III